MRRSQSPLLVFIRLEFENLGTQLTCENLGEIGHVFAVPCRRLQRNLQLQMPPRGAGGSPGDVKVDRNALGIYR